MITLKNIVDEFQTFVDDHLFLKTFSYGSPSSVDLDKFTDYPLLHLVYNGSGYDENEKTYSFDLYILDAPPVGVDPAGKDAYEKQAVTSAEQVSEDILADLENGGKIFQFAYGYEIVSSRTVPLMEQTSGVLTGVLFSLSIATPYLYDACNAPLTGVTPGGSSSPSSSLTGVLRVREVDGTPDVSNVDTIVVTNGTLTDDGSGVVTLDTGGGGGSATLAGLTDVDVTGVSDQQALVYDNSASEWVAGFPNTSGAVSTFLAESIKVSNYTAGVFQNIIIGNILSEITISADMKAGWTAGFDSTTATSLLCAQVTSGTTFQLSIKYDVTLGTASFVVLSNVSTGMLPNIATFPLHTSDASNVTVSSNVKTIVTYQTSNTTKLQITSDGTGTVRILEFKATVVHA